MFYLGHLWNCLSFLVKVVHVVLEGRQETSLEVDCPQLFLLCWADGCYGTIVEGEVGRVLLQHRTEFEIPNGVFR